MFQIGLKELGMKQRVHFQPRTCVGRGGTTILVGNPDLCQPFLAVLNSTRMRMVEREPTHSFKYQLFGQQPYYRQVVPVVGRDKQRRIRLPRNLRDQRLVQKEGKF